MKYSFETLFSWICTFFLESLIKRHAITEYHYQYLQALVPLVGYSTSELAIGISTHFKHRGITPYYTVNWWTPRCLKLRSKQCYEKKRKEKNNFSRIVKNKEWSNHIVLHFFSSNKCTSSFLEPQLYWSKPLSLTFFFYIVVLISKYLFTSSYKYKVQE